MSDIAEHDTDEEGKGNDDERCGVDLCIGRNSISIDNLLRNFKDGVGIKFTRRHFI